MRCSWILIRVREYLERIVSIKCKHKFINLFSFFLFFCCCCCCCCWVFFVFCFFSIGDFLFLICSYIFRTALFLNKPLLHSKHFGRARKIEREGTPSTYLSLKHRVTIAVLCPQLSLFLWPSKEYRWSFFHGHNQIWIWK